MKKDPSLDTLLLLDGESFVADKAGKMWVKFDVKAVEVSAHRPHGIKYSLTLHDEDGERILGFDNAHPVKEGTGSGAQTRIEYDHKHKGDRIRFYELNPAVLPIAQNTFTYIRESGAQISFAVGDARTTLARENPQRFNVLAVDVFTGDAIPLHLLTAQALDLFRNHLGPGGIIAYHISNQHVNLEPAIALLAQNAGRFVESWLRDLWDHAERLTRSLELAGQVVAPSDPRPLLAALLAGDREAARQALHDEQTRFRDAVALGFLAAGHLFPQARHAPVRSRRPDRKTNDRKPSPTLSEEKSR